MSKKERRGNREAKKPKKEKTASAPAASGSPWLTVKTKDRDLGKK
jgi:hypothetical protein